MCPCDDFDSKTRQQSPPGTAQTVDAFVEFAQDNPDKAFVVRSIGQLVAAGHADWKMTRNGAIEVRFTSGETFLLGKTTVFRLF
ncbi:hypothetical protein B0E33_18750 [Roseibium algicola]|uniref:Uncharacterized protein n=1 Tax=Roseibium algicola TaxID=2857014 RepID=A0ABN4WYG0_9HYPH|nr:hypothetical protein B0E33_18750 [Roseibium aggregatum]